MQYVNFGSAGVKVSRLALGLGFRGQNDEQEAEKLVRTALDSGINLIDCANVYGLMDDRKHAGRSEVILGRALKARGLTPSPHHAEGIPGENRTLLDPTLGIYRFNELAVLRGATMPALLLESGIIVNRDEEQAIQSGRYHPKVAAALVQAVTQYCSQ